MISPLLVFPASCGSFWSSETPHDALRGRVLRMGGAPIVRALVIPKSFDGNPVPEIAVTANARDWYDWSLTEGSYAVTATAHGFQRKTKTVEVSGDEVTIPQLQT